MTEHPYIASDYVATLVPDGGHLLKAFGAHLIARPIADSGFDTLGSYPLTPIPAAADLTTGLATLRAEGMVSAVMVPDPLHSPNITALSAAFDFAKPFKTHLLIDGPYAPSRHHVERIRRGHRRCRIETGPLAPWLSDWTTLYADLVEHRGISGQANFTSIYFEHLARVKSLQAFIAYVGDTVAGMTLWFAHDGVVYNHLTACNALGYANGAAFALCDAAINYFDGQGVMNLGGGAGAFGADGGGLFSFKQGFTNSEITAHICGAVLDQDQYVKLSAGRITAFFPAYRG